MGTIVIGVIRIERKKENGSKNASQVNNVDEKIMERSERKLSECDCQTCRKQCKTPCLGTPGDILRLIKAGYGDKLAVTNWMVGILAGEIPFPVKMVQPKQTGSGCVFFRDGLCELHACGLKPTEGKLSYHTIREENRNFRKSLTWNVAKEWLDTRNIPLIIEIVSRLEKDGMNKKAG